MCPNVKTSRKCNLSSCPNNLNIGEMEFVFVDEPNREDNTNRAYFNTKILQSQD